MIERVITFGAENNLVGILTEPETTGQNKRLPCVLILNSGILHHVGPFRLHVLAARHMAARGISVFRFDIGGIGDSLTSRNAEYDAACVIADIRMAMDAISQKKGINEFVLMGLCTGAANAHKVSVVDERVSGGVFLDGYVYPTVRFYIRRYMPVIMDLSRATKWVGRMMRRVAGARREGENEPEMTEDYGWWVLPPKNEVEKNLSTLVDRKVDLLYIFSGEQREYYNYEQQFIHAFSGVDFKGRLKVIFNNEADHTYSYGLDRDRLICQVTDWLKERYGF